MNGLDRQYKIFCVKCDWSVLVNKADHELLWTKLDHCPKCSGPTDAYEMVA
jgi:hypothetical protein